MKEKKKISDSRGQERQRETGKEKKARRKMKEKKDKK